MPRRECGDCQLCCRLLPVVALEKKGGEKCKFQKFHKGCTVYNTRQMPPECRLWSCRWLVNDDAGELGRPDRSHYVIDIMPDFITIVDEGGAKQHVQVVQIWCDPNHRDAHRDPALRAWLARRGEQCVAAIIRFAATGEALLVFPPQLSHDGQWHEVISPHAPERTHSFREIVEALSEGETAHAQQGSPGG
jgi:hypothetical protein